MSDNIAQSEAQSPDCKNSGAASCSVAVLKRPQVNADIIKTAAYTTAKDTNNINKDEIDALAKAIVENFSLYMDGFELAKGLELDGWSVNAMFVEDMDMMDCNVRRHHQRVCEEWVKREDIKPPLDIGCEIEQGIIDHVYEYSPACYAVKENGCAKKSRYLIIKFEDAVATSEPQNGRFYLKQQHGQSTTDPGC